MNDNIVTVILAVFASSGFWAFLTAIVQKPQLSEVSEKVDKLKETVDRNNAILARSHIIRFDDELYNGLKHSQEYFLQIFDDVDTYEDFCRDYPRFENNRCVEAIKHIKAVYQKCRDEHTFV